MKYGTRDGGGYLTTVTAAVILLLLGTPRHAWAYIDPGSGSILFQVLIGTALAGLFALKTYWRRIREKIAGMAQRKMPKDEGEGAHAGARAAEEQGEPKADA